MIHSEYWLIIELNVNFLYIYKKISKFYLQFIYNGVPYLNDDQVCMKNSLDIRHNYVNIIIGWSLPEYEIYCM